MGSQGGLAEGSPISNRETLLVLEQGSDRIRAIVYSRCQQTLSIRGQIVSF